jgi:hypothetical protein
MVVEFSPPIYAKERTMVYIDASDDMERKAVELA